MAIQYTTSEGVSIGYIVAGEGEETVIFVPGIYSNLALDKYFPEVVAWINYLGRLGRVVTFDKRATGVSDRSARPLNLDQQVVDVEAVRIASDSKDLIICGLSQGAPLAVLYALAYPERVRALILLEGVCCDAKDPYVSLSDSNTLFDWERTLTDIDSDFSKWARDIHKLIQPDAGPEDIESEIDYMYATASPASHRFIWCCLMGFDLRPMLRHVNQPTLIVHAIDDQLYPIKHGKYLAEHIPGASYLELKSNSHVPMFDPKVLSQLQEGIEIFVAGLPARHSEESSARVVSTVLFTDIVDSTTQQRKLGDRVWTEIISEFEASSSNIVGKCRGKVVRFTGDGMKAAFDVPGDCLRAARLLVQNANESGHPIRAGLHTGEIQWSGGDMHGMAVNIASRVADQADAGQVLTTNVTQGIVEGGDYTFADWGEVELKGIGTRKLIRLVE